MLAERDQTPLGMLLLMKYRNRISCDYGASDPQHKQLRVNHFLTWEAIQRGVREGYRDFDFGRTSVQNTGIMEYKNKWGASLSSIPYFFYPPLPSGSNATENHVSLKKSLVAALCRYAPDCVQEPIGKFCYLHLG